MEEFGLLTPGMYFALMKRRNVEFKHQCFQSGTMAAMIANMSQRVSSKVWTPWDFVPDEKRNEEREKLKRLIMTMFSFNADKAIQNPMKDEDLIKKTIAKLEAQGYRDAAEIFDELFPGWRQ